MCEIFNAECKPLLETTQMSCGSIFGNRVVAFDDEQCLIASGGKLHLVNLEYPQQYVFKATKSKNVPFPQPCANLKHQSLFSSADEFMELTYNRKYDIIGAVDAYGRAWTFSPTYAVVAMQSLNANSHMEDDEDDNDHMVATKKQRSSQVSQLKTNFHVDKSLYDNQLTQQAGFGTSISIIDQERFVTSRYISKDVTLFHNGKKDRSWQLNTYPTKVKYLFDHLLAVCEYNVLTIYDLRTNAPVTTIPRYECLFDVTASPDNLSVATGGMDRTFHVVDVKKWAPRHKWQNCTKYSASFLSFSAVKPDVAYVAGFDSQELSAGKYKSSKDGENSMYANARWIGLSLVPATDTLLGCSALGHVYAIKKPYQMI